MISEEESICFSEKEVEERKLISRAAEQLEIVLSKALMKTVKDNAVLFDEFFKPLCDYFISDTLFDGSSRCVSLSEMYNSNAFSHRDFIEMFEFNISLFRINLADCSDDFVRSELKLEKKDIKEKCSEQQDGSEILNQNQNLSDDKDGEKSDYLEIDLEESLPTGIIPKFISVKLGGGNSVRFVTEQHFFSLSDRLDRVEEKVDHIAEQNEKLTTLKAQNITLPTGKWLPEAGNFNSPTTADTLLNNKRYVDRRGIKWFLSEKDAFKSAREIERKDSFRNLLYLVFTEEKIKSFKFIKDYPEHMSKACTELFDWIAQIRVKQSIRQVPGGPNKKAPTTTYDTEIGLLNFKFNKFYSNQRGTQKRKQTQQSQKEELAQLKRHRESQDSGSSWSFEESYNHDSQDSDVSLVEK